MSCCQDTPGAETSCCCAEDTKQGPLLSDAEYIQMELDLEQVRDWSTEPA